MLSVRSLYTEYANERGAAVKAAQDVSFEVPEGKLFTLLGPSGCGKTTTLRSIAGLEKPTAGEIEVAGRLVYSSGKGIFVAPNKRNFGMVFQSYAIWPHMNVFQNVAFPLEVRRLAKKEIRDKVMRVLQAVALDELVDRDATKLSGGQQQRLALARALVMEPQLLLLDEPLSNLDAKLRDRMRSELKRLQRDLNLTTVYVTHDQSEALALSHEIAVMNEGRVVQIGTPAPDLRAADRPVRRRFRRQHQFHRRYRRDGRRRHLRRALGHGRAQGACQRRREQEHERDRLGAARGRGIVRRPRPQPPMARTSTKARSAPRIFSATIWIFTSGSAMLCCRQRRIRRCARRPAMRSICG